MEKLAEDQQIHGQEIQRIISNFKKDPADRKTTPQYFEDRLKKLESSWASFEAIDNKIRILPDPPLDHPYFVTEYYKSIKEIYETYRDHFMDRISILKQPASSNQGKVVQIPDTKKSEKIIRPDSPHKSISSHLNVTGTTMQSDTTMQGDIVRIIRRQRGVMQSLRRLIDGIPMDDTQNSRQFFQLKINTINQYWSQIEDHSYTIYELTDDPTIMGYDMDDYTHLEERVQQTLIYLSTKLDEVAASSSSLNRQACATTMLKLPKITLPKFDGEYLRWRQFYDLFNQMVHTQNMANCQKMWYLKTNLSGEAEKLIRHFTLSDENYTAAWKMLQDRYNNPRLLVSALVNKLLSQPSHISDNVSASTIKALHDTTQECLLGLNNLGVSTDDWDPLLLHILLKKLDKSTHMLYEQSLPNPRSIQTVKAFLAFLELRFQSLETLGSKGRNLEEHQRKHSIARTLTSVVAKDPDCVSCKGNHRLYACKNFLRMTPTDRLKLLRRHNLCVNCLRAGHISSKCALRGCTKCNKKHNTLVHLEYPATSEVSTSMATHSTTTPQGSNLLPIKDSTEQSLSLTTLSNKTQRSYVLLSTVRVKLVANAGTSIECRAILDSGSQVNLITERIVKRLGLTSVGESMIIHGIGHGKQQAQRRVNVQLQSMISGFSARLEAFVLPQITTSQPTQPLDTSTWSMPHNIRLADPNFNQPERIDLLLGAEFFYQLLSIGQIKLGEDLPILQNTVFGWIVAGKINKAPLLEATCGICSEDEGLEQQIERFWRLEEGAESKPSLTTLENQCETHFNQTVKRAHNGRFIVKLPFRDDPAKLGESKDLAYRRFLALERKLARNIDLKQQYVEFMNEYLKLGHMEEIDIKTIQSPHYFLPHHSVLKPDSSTTKLRVVFDASARTSSNVSLNNLLHAGPLIQDDLFSILIRFRMPRFVFTADIQKMYRQILLNEDDKKYHLIFWRSDPTQDVKCYQLSTVTYGTTSAPYLATKCLQKLAHDSTKKYPLGSQVLENDFYVDDVMTGSNNLFTAIESQAQLVSLLQEAGFKLRKWCANHPRLLKNIPTEDQEIQLDFTDEREESIKTLGLTWLPKSDNFCIKANWVVSTKVTKRAVASDIARLFDPLGIMAPVVITAKIFLQQLWQLKLDWDAALPMEMHSSWIKFRDSLKLLNNVQYPRQVVGDGDEREVQLHAFADASEKAYGSVVYLRSINKDGCIVIRLLCAKSRVAPVKKISLPRLELCAAKLAAELTDKVRANLKLDNVITHFWTDSEIVLAWINSSSSSLQTFVANRVSAIQTLTIARQWRHVTSKENPADVLSRGIAPEKLRDCNLWFYGPPFLHGRESIWPLPYKKNTECDLERKKTALPVTSAKVKDNHTHFVYRINHRNSFRKLQRIIAYMIRFISRIKKRNNTTIIRQPPTTQELNNALYIIIKLMQGEEFKEEIQQIKKYHELKKTSAFSGLAPFLDEMGILRVGGRLEAADLTYDAKHPILIPYSSVFTKLLMTDLHKENLHVGPQTLLSITRQRFWPIKGKTIARSIVQHCVRCARMKPKLLTQMMGNLPPNRVQPARPFVNAGVDFCGPIWIHYRTRGKRPQKGYVAVFCCFATKSVHLEVVSDLSTEAFIGSLKRFIGRRGHCKNLYCDNATNFVGARNQLGELSQNIYSNQSQEDIMLSCSKKGIDFHFIPPRAPHFGGLWEAAVKSAKHLLQRSVSSASLTYEELETVIIEIEAILNSRPLTPMSADPNDFTSLTPGHFLIGEPLTSSIDPLAEPVKVSLLKRWKLVSHIKHEFWRRWSQEYLHGLQHRLKWKQGCSNIQPGTMVVIKEDNMPVMKWSLGRIVEVYKGDDGYVRVANVRTASGILRRPIHKLAPLPVEEEFPKQNLSISQDKEDKKWSREHQEVHNSKRQMDNADSTRPPDDDDVTAHSFLTTTESPKKKMRRAYGSSVVTLLLACMMLPVIRSSEIQVTQFDTQPGIHFENLGTASLVTTEWDIVVYYDLHPYWMEFASFKNGTKALQHLCDQISKKSYCTHIISQFSHLQEELSQDNELLTANQHSHKGKRSAPLNIVGNIASALFGVLDSEYADKMSETIENIKENEDHLITLLKNQTSIIDSTVNIIKRDQAGTERKFQALDNQLRQIINRINTTGEEAYQLKLQQIFTSLSIQMTLITSYLQWIQSSIIDVITDTHHGKISPLLLSPSQLKQEVITIRNHLSPSLRLPMDPDNILKLYQLMTTESRIVNNHVIFRIKIPLVNLENFDLFKLFPIPTVINDTFVAIDPSTNLLAISPHRDQYYPLTEAELSSCIVIEKELHLCKQSHPIYHKGAGINACEISLINNMPMSRSCKVRSVENNPIWMQLSQPNQWIYALKEKTSVNVVCDKKAFAVNLNGSGLITFQPNCIIKHDLITIQGHRVHPSNMRSSYTKLGGLPDDTTPQELPPTIQDLTHYHAHTSELRALIEEISLQQLELPKKIHVHNIHHSAVGYAGLSLVTIVIIYLIWKFRGGTCNQPSENPPAPPPRRLQREDFNVNI